MAVRRFALALLAPFALFCCRPTSAPSVTERLLQPIEIMTMDATMTTTMETTMTNLEAGGPPPCADWRAKLVETEARAGCAVTRARPSASYMDEARRTEWRWA